MKFLLLVLLSGFCIIGFAQSTQFFDSLGIISENQQVKKISSQFSFTEGPAADKRGNVYFTDQPNNKIWFFNAKTEKLREFKKYAGRANGLFIDKEGNIIACADENNELWSIDKNGEVKILLGAVDGKRLNGPNDLWIDAKEGIYFTDPYYQRDYWTRQKPEIVGQKVYYLAAGSTQPVVVDSTIVKPNGIIGHGNNLFVADIGDNKTYKYTINKNGSLSNKALFVQQGSDGMTLDENGNLYLTGHGVTVYNRNGVKVAHIPVPEKWTGNICFAGKKRNFIFITAGKSIYTLKMKVRGAGK
ncbi:SMP-30/gluconolactonase/LRE family protein [Niabella ginsengisoli]|uniref:SMP-30/gluconolactonase/LRE family protein n=1 Tax=Niabella ginsengisoli TaxID=522298 RepID=A0ABS9SQV7_9BACT|nr:SMP-30/gluconolactonase/LRE family protein [Niabella ginsengisoli]MCH5600621.1 SMP-30/gluconolactonase/LRE family protein [Niabella ginsengisoli]